MAVIEEHWLAAVPQVTSALNLDLYRLRLFADQLILDGLRRVNRRVLIYNLIGEALSFYVLASQCANLLLLLMVVCHWAEPWPLMQFSLASAVVLAVVLDIIWLHKMNLVLH